MTRQTVSICNCKGGVALDELQAGHIAKLLEEIAADYGYPKTGLTGRVIRVLCGEAPAELGEMA